MEDEDAMHEIKQFCLMNIPIRAVWLGRVRRLSPQHPQEIPEYDERFDDPDLLWNAFEQKMAQVKGFVANAQSPEELANAILKGIGVQEWYEQEMMVLFSNWPVDNMEIKAGTWISSGVMRFEYRAWLKAGELLQEAPTYAPNILLELGRIQKLKNLKTVSKQAS